MNSGPIGPVCVALSSASRSPSFIRGLPPTPPVLNSEDRSFSDRRWKARPRSGASGLSCIRSEEHTSELQSLMRISYAVFCLKNKKQQKNTRKQTEKIEDSNDQPSHSKTKQAHKTQQHKYRQ